MANNKQTEKDWETVDKTLEKHTVALTKTNDIVSFDTVVLNKYEAQKDLVDLLQKEREQAIQATREETVEEVKTLFRNTGGSLVFTNNQIMVLLDSLTNKSKK